MYAHGKVIQEDSVKLNWFKNPQFKWVQVQIELLLWHLIGKPDNTAFWFKSNVHAYFVSSDWFKESLISVADGQNNLRTERLPWLAISLPIHIWSGKDNFPDSKTHDQMLGSHMELSDWILG